MSGDLCPLWVKTGPDEPETELPKYPREQTFSLLLACLMRATSRLMHRNKLHLLDHLVCDGKHSRRNGKAERLGCLGIDDQLEPDRLFDRKISRFFTL